MFLTLAYGLFIFQAIALLLLILPIPIRIRRYVTESVVAMSDSFYLRTAFTIIAMIMFGLFVENLVTVYKYDALRHDLSDILLNHAIPGKHEVLLKLFRAQRNLYLTFMVNFNWLVMYGIYKFIRTIHHLESLLKTRAPADEALVNDIIRDENLQKSLKEKSH